MKHRSLVITLLSIFLPNGAITGGGLLHAQEAGPRSRPVIPTVELSRIHSGKMPVGLESPARADVARLGVAETQVSQTPESGRPPVPPQIVAQFLQLQPNQVQEFLQLVQSRQEVIATLLEQIQPRTRELVAQFGR